MINLVIYIQRPLDLRDDKGDKYFTVPVPLRGLTLSCIEWAHTETSRRSFVELFQLDSISRPRDPSCVTEICC